MVSYLIGIYRELADRVTIYRLIYLYFVYR